MYKFLTNNHMVFSCNGILYSDKTCIICKKRKRCIAIYCTQSKYRSKELQDTIYFCKNCADSSESTIIVENNKLKTEDGWYAPWHFFLCRIFNNHSIKCKTCKNRFLCITSPTSEKG